MATGRVLITVNSGYGQISQEIGCLLVVLPWCIVYGINAPNGQGCQLIFITLSCLSCSGSTTSSLVTGNAGLWMSCMPWDVRVWQKQGKKRRVPCRSLLWFCFGLLRIPHNSGGHRDSGERVSVQGWLLRGLKKRSSLVGLASTRYATCQVAVRRHCVDFTSVLLQPSKRGHVQGYCAFKGTFSPVPLLGTA